MELDLFFNFPNLKSLIIILAIIAGIFVITTKNAIISVFNLIVLYILVAFYLIYLGITYLGLSYIIIYIGAIAILFLFVILIIDIEVVEKKNNNYLPLLFFLLGGFLFTLKNILYDFGAIKIKNILFINNNYLLLNDYKNVLFNIDYESKVINNNLIHNRIINENNYLNNNIYNTFSNQINLLDSYKDNYNLFNKKYKIFNENIENISILKDYKYEQNFDNINEITSSMFNKYNIKETKFLSDEIFTETSDNNYLLIIPEWDSVVNKVTQISNIGDVLYTVYHSYIYIVSVILLLAMVGAIILTAEYNLYKRIITIKKPIIYDLNKEKLKISNIFFPIILIYNYLYKSILFYFNKNKQNLNNKLYFNLLLIWFNIVKITKIYINKIRKNFFNLIIRCKDIKYYTIRLSAIAVYPFSDIINNENNHSEGMTDTLFYYMISNIIIGLLLLLINSTFSLSIKYLEKGGGFECGFTSFFQTRERYNIIFYRVSLLFLIFDLEIILAFPYTVLYQKNQNMSKNNILVFLYILVVGFIYELKEGALNIVKTPHDSDIILK